MANLFLTKQYLQKYHERVKQLPLQEKYKQLGETDSEKESGGLTIVDAINKKLSKQDNLVWDEKLVPYNDDNSSEEKESGESKN